MLVIRMARGGRNKYPVYRIVAADKARPVTGKFVAVLGHYNPHTKDLTLDKEGTLKYIGNGAQPSNAVIKLLQKEKVKLPDWVVLKTKNKKSKQEPTEEPVTEEAAPEAQAAPAEETPAEEPAAEAETEEKDDK